MGWEKLCTFLAFGGEFVDERTRIDQQAREFFEGLWQRGDHWGLESSAFEQMKYARILALLDGGHYPRVLELGCGAGTLTRHLASRADYVLALDIASGAIDRAQALWTGPATVDFRMLAILRSPRISSVPRRTVSPLRSS